MTRKILLNLTLIVFLCVACQQRENATQDISTENDKSPTSTKPTAVVDILLSTETLHSSIKSPTPTHIPVFIEPAVTIEVPQGTMPVMDGTLSEGEWNDARVEVLSNGGQLYLMHANGYVFLGIKGSEEGIGSVCQYKDGGVEVLHISGGCVTFLYEQTPDAWHLLEMRTGTYYGLLPEDQWQEQHLKDYGWTATVFYAGNPGEIEYQIAMEGGEIILAVTFVYGYEGTSLQSYEYWPEHLTDDCGRMETVEMISDISYVNFEPETWVKIIAVE